MSNLVSEKQAGLRLALCNMGMLDSAYWASWMAFDAVVTLITALLLVLFGERLSGSWWVQQSCHNILQCSSKAAAAEALLAAESCENCQLVYAADTFDSFTPERALLLLLPANTLHTTSVYQSHISPCPSFPACPPHAPHHQQAWRCSSTTSSKTTLGCC
jgi:hypothetical protein